MVCIIFLLSCSDSPLTVCNSVIQLDRHTQFNGIWIHIMFLYPNCIFPVLISLSQGQTVIREWNERWNTYCMTWPNPLQRSEVFRWSFQINFSDDVFRRHTQRVTCLAQRQALEKQTATRRQNPRQTCGGEHCIYCVGPWHLSVKR